MNESMSTPAGTGSDAGAGSEESGFGLSLGRVAEVFYAPVAMFQSMASRWAWSDWMAPILVGVVISLVITGMVWPHLDLIAPTRDALESRGIAPDQIEQQVAAQEELFAGPFGTVIQYVQVVFYPLVLLVLALIFWGAASVMGGRLTLGRTFSILGYAWLPRVVEGLILIFVLQGREGVNPQRLPSLMVTNPASFLDPSAAGTPLYALLASLNPFALWSMILVALGLAGMGKMSRGSAYVMVGGLYAVWILIQLGWAALT
ncbi:MAG: YIP1 family protein [Acidobacteria bacterium]|nr:YIP1 family protein [Acidobacteriota bacterium]